MVAASMLNTPHTCCPVQVLPGELSHPCALEMDRSAAATELPSHPYYPIAQICALHFGPRKPRDRHQQH